MPYGWLANLLDGLGDGLRLWLQGTVHEGQDEQTRLAAVARLAEEQDPTALEPLIDALADPSAEVRRAAAEALGVRGDPRAVPVLSRAFYHEDYFVQRAIVEALGHLGPEAVEPLVAL